MRDQAFETHHTLHNMHRILQVSAALPASSQLPVHVTSILRSVIRFGLGYSRFAYPDRLPAFTLSPIARPAGPPGTNGSTGLDPFNFTVRPALLSLRVRPHPR